MEMELEYTRTEKGVRIDKVRDPGSVVVIPEEIEGMPVTELGAYVLAESQVGELHLPPALAKIGAYAFYNCEQLRRITCYSRIGDLGTGMFAGGKGAEFLDFYQMEGEKSYLKDMLSELHQTLRVRIHGAQEARLIFPEYFEESVENTPARILVIETHGCGHRYRYCFANREFQYRSYDELFPHVQVQEQEALVTELALGRILYPCGLTEDSRKMYRSYVEEHWKMAGQLIVEANCRRREDDNNLDRGLMPWFAEHYIHTDSQLQVLIETAQKAGDTETVSWLMNCRYERFWREDGSPHTNVSGTATESGAAIPDTTGKKRRFEL